MGVNRWRSSEQTLEFYDAGESETLALFGNLVYFSLSGALFAFLIARMQGEKKKKSSLHKARGSIFRNKCVLDLPPCATDRTHTDALPGKKTFYSRCLNNAPD